MDIKYVFLDIDGTLADRDGQIPDSAREAIREARKNGHKIFIGSGRSRCEMPDHLLQVGVDGIIGSAGAYVEMDGTVIFHRPMTEEMNRELFAYFEKKQMEILVETNDDLLVNASGRKTVEEYVRYCQEHDETYNKDFYDLVRPLEDIAEPEKLAINKILYVNSPYDNKEIRKELQDKYTVVDSAIELKGNSGEISEKGMHKGKGIAVVMDYLGADPQDTIAIGDGENDIEMLKAAHIGIAMGNANERLKGIADYVTTDVDKDGIKNAFVHYGLISAK